MVVRENLLVSKESLLVISGVIFAGDGNAVKRTDLNFLEFVLMKRTGNNMTSKVPTD